MSGVVATRMLMMVLKNSLAIIAKMVVLAIHIGNILALERIWYGGDNLMTGMLFWCIEVTVLFLHYRK